MNYTYKDTQLNTLRILLETALFDLDCSGDEEKQEAVLMAAHAYACQCTRDEAGTGSEERAVAV